MAGSLDDVASQTDNLKNLNNAETTEHGVVVALKGGSVRRMARHAKHPPANADGSPQVFSKVRLTGPARLDDFFKSIAGSLVVENLPGFLGKYAPRFNGNEPPRIDV